MNKYIWIIAISVIGIPEASAAGATDRIREAQCDTYLSDTLQTIKFPITTNSLEAQRLFEEGLTLAYSFNHPEAARSFRLAIAEDPTCAMCYWGLAYVLGPNINSPMPASHVNPANWAVSQAILNAPGVSPLEHRLIHALDARYQLDSDDDRSHLDAAYAEAMKRVAISFPDNVNVLVLYGEALMDTSPWDYWDPDGSQNELTIHILRTLNTALVIEPSHQGAIHFYIHAVEKPEPQRAEDAADRLDENNTNVSHMVHMPGHIYLRLGRYNDVVRVNQKASDYDQEYVAACNPDGIYANMYIPHNLDFLVAGANLAGRSQLALQRAEQLMDMATPIARANPQMMTAQALQAVYYTTLVRFRRWETILALPKPAANLLYTRSIFHYARALAHAHTVNFDAAENELTKLYQLTLHPDIQDVSIMEVNKATDILKIAYDEASGVVAALNGDDDRAEQLLNLAATRQDQLSYMEPPPWHRSVRVVLGHFLLTQGESQRAEAEFRQNLEKYPKNGWGLYGLSQSFYDQSRLYDGYQAMLTFEEVWRQADTLPEVW